MTYYAIVTIADDSLVYCGTNTHEAVRALNDNTASGMGDSKDAAIAAAKEAAWAWRKICGPVRIRFALEAREIRT